jgi:hypothetical protein
MNRPPYPRETTTASFSAGRVFALRGLASSVLVAATCGCQSLADFERAPGDESAALESPIVEPDDAVTDAEGTEPSDEIPPVCTEDGGTTAPCEGTWRYRRWASCIVSDTGPVTPAACSSAPSCAAFRTCADWSFGSGAPSTQTQAFEHRVKTCRSPGCFDACEEQAENIQAAQDALRDSVPPEFRDQVLIVEQVDSRISSDSYSPGLFEDDKFDELRVCTVTFEAPVPASGQGAVCGCATLVCNAPACGADPNEFTSPPGLTFEALLAQDPALADSFTPSCSACDDLPSAGDSAPGPS